MVLLDSTGFTPLPTLCRRTTGGGKINVAYISLIHVFLLRGKDCHTVYVCLRKCLQSALEQAARMGTDIHHINHKVLPKNKGHFVIEKVRNLISYFQLGNGKP